MNSLAEDDPERAVGERLLRRLDDRHRRLVFDYLLHSRDTAEPHEDGLPIWGDEPYAISVAEGFWARRNDDPAVEALCGKGTPNGGDSHLAVRIALRVLFYSNRTDGSLPNGPWSGPWICSSPASRTI